MNVNGAEIELLSWGEIGSPGLLLAHGNAAHADWWSFIAPFFAEHWRVVALSWSGMGRSDWRASYSMADHVDEAFGAAEAAGLFQASEKPVFVGHSFGGAPVMHAAAIAGEKLRRAIIVDSGARPGDWPLNARVRTRANRIYDSFEDGLSRFRLSPAQPCENLYLIDHVARGSLMQMRDLVGRPDGWAWAFDPFAGASLGVSHISRSGETISSARCAMDFIWGEDSVRMPREIVENTRRVAPTARMIGIPASGHHIMLDQPIALIAALRTLLLEN